MRRWVTSFSLLLLLVPSGGTAQERLTQDEALRLAFPAPAIIERRTAYLGESDVNLARGLAGEEVEITQRVVTYYVGRREESPVGVAYFDSHRVRSKHEVAMIVVGVDGLVRQVEILRFDEPPEYRATDPWLDQLTGEQLAPSLSLKGGIINLTGATLTSRALVRATRRALALHQVIRPFGSAR